MPIVRLQKVETKLKRPLADISPPEFRRGLAKSPTFPWLRTEEALDSEELLPTIQREVPIDGVEIVEWMQVSASDLALLDAVVQDYNRIGSQLLSASGDPYIPGVKVGNLTIPSVTGATVLSQGYGTVGTPRGNFNVPVGGKATGIFSDILAWAAMTYAMSVQWVLSLLQWRDLASTPIDQRVRFANVGGHVAPQFFVAKSSLPSPAIMMSMGFTSNRSQKVGLQMRSTGDYTTVIGEDMIEIPAGESTLDYFILGFPLVEPFMAHFQPEDNSNIILDSLTVTPP